jgi:DNA-binding CsgD family transcriptional regulator
MHVVAPDGGLQEAVVETIDTVLLRLYGAATEVAADEFPAFALSLVQGLRGSGPADVAGVLAAHVQQAIAINRVVHRAVPPSPVAASASAICRINGELQFAAPAFTALLALEWPGLEDETLPEELLAVLRPGAGLRFNGQRIVVDARVAGELVMLAGRVQSPLMQLSQRETQTVMLFGAGKSTKEIARVLDVTHNSVRNFVQRAYKKLGVSDKAELAVLIGGWSAPGV